MSKLICRAVLTENNLFSAELPNSQVHILQLNHITGKHAFVEIFDDKVVVKNLNQPFNYFEKDTLLSLLQKFMSSKTIYLENNKYVSNS